MAGTLLVLLGTSIGWESTFSALKRTGPFAFVLFGLTLWIPVLATGSSWRILSRAMGRPLGTGTSLGTAVVGMTVNILTPSAYLGGEAGKVVYAAKRGRESWERMAGLALLVKSVEAVAFGTVFGLAAGVVLLSIGAKVPGGAFLLIPAGLLLGAVACFWIGLARGRRPLAGVVRLLRRIRPDSRRFARFWKRVAEAEERIARACREEPRALLAALGVNFVAQAAILLRPLVFFGFGLGFDLGLGEICLLTMAGQGLLAFQIAPSGLGTFDGGMLGVFALVGIPAAPGAAFLLATRFYDATVAGTGLVLGVRAGARLFGGVPEPVEMAVAGD